MAKQPKIRFTFVLDNEPGPRLTAGQWRVHVNRNDVYISDTNVGGIWKASLHDDVAWRVAATREAMEGPNPPLWQGADRALWKFEPTPFVNGVRQTFVVAAARGAFTPGYPGSRDQRILVPDRWDQLVYASVWMTEPDVEFPAPENLIARPLWLRNGRGVWVTQELQDVPPVEPEPVPESQIVRPLTPGKDDVPCPGYLLTGVHVDRGESTASAPDPATVI